MAGPSLAQRAGDVDAALEQRRVRVRSYLIPSSDVHVCRGTGQLVQSMQKNFKYRCGATDVYTDEVRERILNVTMPAIEQWIAQTVLLPAPAAARGRSPPSLSSHLGVCEGMLRGYLPKHHVRETGRGQGAADAVREFDLPLPSSSSVAARTGTRTLGRGGLWNKQQNTYDLVIYVTTMLSALFVDAFPCQFDAVTGRPTVLHVNLDPGLYTMSVGLADSDVVAALFQSRLVLREVVVAMATKNFLAALDPTYYRRLDNRSETGYVPVGRGSVIGSTMRPEGDGAGVGAARARGGSGNAAGMREQREPRAGGRKRGLLWCHWRVVPAGADVQWRGALVRRSGRCVWQHDICGAEGERVVGRGRGGGAGGA